MRALTESNRTVERRYKMIRVGIVGLGRQGMLHLMNCSCFADIRVVAAADKSKKQLSRAKSLSISSLYENYEDMFRAHKDLNTVIISLPNFLHETSIQSALECGFNVFVEKPLANTTSECQHIVDAVRRTGMKFMIGHNHRFYEAIEKMKEYSEKGYIGDIEAITGEEVTNGPFSHPVVPSPVAEWWFDPTKTGGGVLMDVGYHLIDLFRFIAGDADLLYSEFGHRLRLPVEDSAVVVLKSSLLTKGLIYVGWYQRTTFPRFDFRFILHGNAGYLSTEDLIPRNLYTFAAKEGMKNVLRKMTGRKIKPLRYTYYYESYYKELAHFFDCIRNDRTPSVTAEDGLKAIEIIDKAYKQTRRD